MTPDASRATGLAALMVAALALAVPAPARFSQASPPERRIRPAEDFLRERATARYRVEPNDTLSQIAQRYGLRRGEILGANPWLKDRQHRLEIHEVLQLPLGFRP